MADSPSLNLTSLLPTRRAFLGTAAGAAVAASARVLGAAETTDEVRVAVIGTGARGCDLVRALTTIDGVKIAGIADDYPPHLADGAKFAGPQAETFNDYRRLLDKLRPQAVVVAVPLALHHQVASDALAAGCDVFCEKTMCYTIDEARRLAEQAHESKRVFQVGLQRRANPIYDQAAAIAESGLIGQISAIKCQWHRNNNWRRPVPVARTDPKWAELEHRLNWRLYRATSAGLMAELGSHQLDVANLLLKTPPKRVAANGGIDYWRDGRDVFDNIFCTYEYELMPVGNRGTPPGPKENTAGTAVPPKAMQGSTGRPPVAPGQTSLAPALKPYTVRVTYSSLCNNAFEGASELVLGSRGTLLLTSTKGLLYKEQGADLVQWASGGGSDERASANASVVTAGKTLKLSNDPWAHRGKPVEIENQGGDDTRAELVSFIDHVRRGDPATICDAAAGLINAATVLIAVEAAETGKTVEFPHDLA